MPHLGHFLEHRAQIIDSALTRKFNKPESRGHKPRDDKTFILKLNHSITYSLYHLFYTTPPPTSWSPLRLAKGNSPRDRNETSAPMARLFALCSLHSALYKKCPCGAFFI